MHICYIKQLEIAFSGPFVIDSETIQSLFQISFNALVFLSIVIHGVLDLHPRLRHVLEFFLDDLFLVFELLLRAFILFQLMIDVIMLQFRVQFL